jgi:hypothetical protein
MKIVTIDKNETTKPTPKYVALTDAMKEKPMSDIISDSSKNRPIKSKVLIIKNLSVTITQEFDEDVDFVIKTDPGVLSDNKTIPELDICAKEDVEFDEDITRAKLESIIRRCGILDKYKDYFVTDPDIIIDSYTLTIKKSYRYFNEFKEGILIGSDIFM